MMQRLIDLVAFGFLVDSHLKYIDFTSALMQKTLENMYCD